MRNMQSIETIFDGWKFCSELDAQWAVFFKTLGVTYRYESICNMYSHFWIEEWKSIVVIIPDSPTNEDMNICKMLASHTNTTCLLIRGAPLARMEDTFLGQWAFAYRFMIIPPQCMLVKRHRPLQRQYTVSEELFDAWLIPQCDDLDMTCCVFAFCRSCCALGYIDVEHGTLCEPVSIAYNDGYGMLTTCSEGCTWLGREPRYDNYRLVAAYTAARMAQFLE